MTEQAPVDYKAALPAVFDDNLKTLAANAIKAATTFFEGYKRGSKDLWKALGEIAKFHTAAVTTNPEGYREALRGLKFRVADDDDLVLPSIRFAFGMLPRVTVNMTDEEKEAHENAVKDASRWSKAVRHALVNGDANAVAKYLEENGGISKVVEASRAALPTPTGQGACGSDEGPSEEQEAARLNALWDEISARAALPKPSVPGKYLAFVSVEEGGKQKIINFVPDTAISVEDVLKRVHEALAKEHAQAEARDKRKAETAAKREEKRAAKVAERAALCSRHT